MPEKQGVLEARYTAIQKLQGSRTLLAPLPTRQTRDRQNSCRTRITALQLRIYDASWYRPVRQNHNSMYRTPDDGTPYV